MTIVESGVKELPPLREECDAEDNSHALSVCWCSKEGSKRGILVGCLLHSQRVYDLCHFVLDKRVTLIKPDGVEARKYSRGLACLQLGVDRRYLFGDRRTKGKRHTDPFEISHLGLSGINLS
jgi:hypothetical protein